MSEEDRTRNIGIRITLDLFADLAEIASAKGGTITSIVNEALAEARPRWRAWLLAHHAPKEAT